MTDWTYEAPGETVRRFFQSPAFVRGIRGPVGSGKSAACCAFIFMKALAQKPGKDGVRRTRWAVIRNTQPELKTTTIKTWLDWFPEEDFGKFKWSSPFTHPIRKGQVEIEMLFLALDTPEDVKKLLSLELTGVWINEARQVPKAILDAATGRVDRFPSARDGGCSWSGVIMDTNSPDEDHWWAIMSGDKPPPDWMTDEEKRQLVRPDGWAFFSQPPAMLKTKDADGVTSYKVNPRRENQKGVKDRYYEQQLAGKTRNYIDVYLCNEYGSLADGKAVHPDFDRALHVSASHLSAAPHSTVFVGLDFGLSPAALFGQSINGRWLILRELVTFDTDIIQFAKLLRRTMAEVETDGTSFSIWGDPAGDIRSQTDKTTPFQILRKTGINARPTETNDIALRLSAVNGPLTRLVAQKPGVIVDPRCQNWIRGAEGGYQYRRIQTAGERFEDKPDKNRFSHVHDAGQYMFLGGGEGRHLMRGQEPMQVVHKERKWDVFARKPINQTVRLKGW